MSTFLLVYTFMAGVIGWGAAMSEWPETRESPFWIRLSAVVLVVVFMFFFWPISLAMFVFDRYCGGR